MDDSSKPGSPMVRGAAFVHDAETALGVATASAARAVAEPKTLPGSRSGSRAQALQSPLRPSGRDQHARVPPFFGGFRLTGGARRLRAVWAGQRAGKAESQIRRKRAAGFRVRHFALLVKTETVQRVKA